MSIEISNESELAVDQERVLALAGFVRDALKLHALVELGMGDIVVCPQVAKAQAITAGHETINEILLLVTHGMLHLVGFDHAEKDEEKEMFDLQKRLLLEFYESETK